VRKGEKVSPEIDVGPLIATARSVPVTPPGRWPMKLLGK